MKYLRGPVASRLRLFALTAVCAVIGLLYAHEFNINHEWPPRHYLSLVRLFGPHSLIVLNVALMTGFFLLLPFRQNSRHVWLPRGLSVAFMVSLMLEMFGLPLFIYLLAPVVSIPRLGNQYLEMVGHWPVTIGMGLVVVGMVVVVWGWVTLYRSGSHLATGGLYRYVRHPQYVGLILFIVGWLLHWPTVLTLLLFPALIIAYVRAAQAEERQMYSEVGDDYARYVQTTGFLLPRLRGSRSSPSGVFSGNVGR